MVLCNDQSKASRSVPGHEKKCPKNKTEQSKDYHVTGLDLGGQLVELDSNFLLFDR